MFFSGFSILRIPAGLGLSIEDADQNLDKIEALFTCLTEPSDIAGRWRQVVREHSVSGKQAHDARLVALMLSHGVTQLLTLNTSDFVRYPEIAALTPADILSL